MEHPSSSAANAGAPATTMAPSLEPLANDFDPDRLESGTPSHSGEHDHHHDEMTMPMDSGAPMDPSMPMNHAMPTTELTPGPRGGATPPGATGSVLKAPAAVYTCTMHPDVTSDKPGKCPKCGMKLVPTTEVEHGKKAEALWHQQHSGSVSATPVAPATKPTASALRLLPGHPPLTGEDVADYLRLVAAEGAPSSTATSAACGGCGMSAKAMAAGEPCEHSADADAAAAPAGGATRPAHTHGG